MLKAGRVSGIEIFGQTYMTEAGIPLPDIWRQDAAECMQGLVMKSMHAAAELISFA